MAFLNPSRHRTMPYLCVANGLIVVRNAGIANEAETPAVCTLNKAITSSLHHSELIFHKSQLWYN
jgi:hypothetical protein